MSKTEKLKTKKTSSVKKKFAPKKTPRKRNFSFKGLNGQRYLLTPQQKSFAVHYCRFDMNGTSAVIEAGYNIRDKKGFINYNLASSIASENLRKPAICAYINVLFGKMNISDEEVDAELSFVIKQKADFNPKIRAIDIYYKKKGQYAPEKIEHSLDKKLEEFLNKQSEKLK